MSDRMSRRALLLRGGAALTAGALGLRGLEGLVTGGPAARAADLRVGPARNTNMHLAGTDGWISLPVPPGGGKPPYLPDPLAPDPMTTYVFGFRDVTGMTDAEVRAQKGKAQICAPLIYCEEGGTTQIVLTNLGFHYRPDLPDGHTIHWHGFRDAIPRMDGVPETSVSAPVGRDLPFLFHPKDPGTYMYHCHFEDVEHVQMGMTGVIVVTPAQSRALDPPFAGRKFAYNDGDGSTRYDREFAFMLTDMWLRSHWEDAHIQQPEWSDYEADAWLLNGRSYPDTLAPGGDPLRVPPDPRLRYQPISSLVSANAGDEVLLRFASLGYRQHTMTAPGLDLRVVGRDATLLRGRDGTDLSYTTDSIDVGPGESFDAIFTAPAVDKLTTYLLYDRAYADDPRRGAGGLGGMVTEIRVHPAGTLAAQGAPNA
jgi:FtsP/CotA-like multicopper oxidase with cupredoxin domain